MILNSTVDNQAVLSNVGTVNSFSIKATAKSFKILSDGLYANKVRAIIRELSCNAYDSHVAAGKRDVPFEVHLPTTLEPWFHVRDFGTGLSKDEVTNIFTTFFESTKTGSNDFVGALGLGSKSPFSYTDNFTVTAVKNNRKGIYTAFINDHGVPSIALMVEQETTDEPGVEIKFSVNERYDFSNFENEAESVFTYFKVKPKITGKKITIPEIKYQTKDIVPGVHQIETSGYNKKSVAVMGNIAYPIERNDKMSKQLGSLVSLLDCGLELNFEIGELDFQASREGLSYIDLTINSIKNKLTQLNSQLAVHIALEADKIDNKWERVVFLHSKIKDPLWGSAITKYVIDTKFEMAKATGSSYDFILDLVVPEKTLAEQFNISMTGFNRTRFVSTTSQIKPHTRWVGGSLTEPEWLIQPSMRTSFVVNDTKVGVVERAKFHWKTQRSDDKHSEMVYVLNPADKTKPMKTDEFFNCLKNPPKSAIFLASTLTQKDRKAGLGKNVNILKLSSKDRSGWRYDSSEWVWRDAGKLDTFDSKATHYYIPLSGFASLGEVDDIKALKNKLDKSNLFDSPVYGVRKGDIEEIKKLKNWVNLDTHIRNLLTKFSQNSLLPLVKSRIDFESFFKYNKSMIADLKVDSPYRLFFEKFVNVTSMDRNQASSIEQLAKLYKIDTSMNSTSLEAEVAAYKKVFASVVTKYPLLEYTSHISNTKIVSDYINMIDNS